jgi:hypothetical protein
MRTRVRPAAHFPKRISLVWWFLALQQEKNCDRNLHAIAGMKLHRLPEDR